MTPARPSPRRGTALAALLVALGVAALGVLLFAGWQVFGSDTPPPLAGPARPVALAGVNLAGGEFGPEGVYEGVYDQDYSYPGAATGAPFLAAGMNTVRLPIRWERIQHAPLAPLDATELARIDATVAALSGFSTIIVDVHNYARYRGTRLTDDARSAAMLADLWRRLATHFRDDRRVAYGLMNEPVDISAAGWARIAAASVTAIRDADATGLILVPGTDWTGAHSWTGGSDSNAAALATFRDPGHNFAFEMHQYFDWNSSGTSETCVSPAEGVRRLTAATAWLRARHARGFLGEFGAARNAACLATLDAALDYLDHNSDVWLGWTAWAGGDRWGDYMYSVQPAADGSERPQMTVLRRHLPH